ncbi:hypothetical protein Vadar_032636 [Vaccinium darrowii]|uniref:Uncharacterized protein n=1 Tax=Vaccinium darrowii TaxID=229202 RepID=A0ACB7YAQ2_9ERIC|nr:hypothetical protein Vadar_032636 [Vaccinium darrowii]
METVRATTGGGAAAVVGSDGGECGRLGGMGGRTKQICVLMEGMGGRTKKLDSKALKNIKLLLRRKTAALDAGLYSKAIRHFSKIVQRIV